MDAIRHAVTLAENNLRWARAQAELKTAHPGIACHLTAASVQLDAVRKLFDLKEEA